ncbi:BamA/TamA family outer membrane protein [Albibacterium indicum]|uniref:BamA/TamA family outer membrane protein n=1 Tax=Albibacterium indicum TaxID=2292082 RepID=UPI000E4A238A|nr:BamA/TamA family outer membrane protein [Pedobacter indicus]
MKTGSIFLSLVLLLFLSSTPLYAQKKLWDHPLIKRLTSSTADTSRKPTLLVIPTLSYSQETGLEYGLSGMYNFYVNRTDTTIYTSSLIALASMTTEKQVNLKLESDIWTRNNDYHYITTLRYKKYPFSYYGLGDQTNESDKTTLTQNLIQINLEAEKKVLKNYYAGLNAIFENFDFSDYGDESLFDPNLIYGAGGGKYLALGISQSYDTRNSNTETTQGLYGRLKYAYAPDFWREDNFHGGILSADLRAFFDLKKNFVLGVQGYFESVMANKVPFYMTRQLGNDSMMRGYYQGRYRANNYIASQAELRYRIHPRIGMAAFFGIGSVYDSQIDLSSLKISGGGGVRYFFDLQHGSSIRLDYAIGEKRPGEKRQGGFYLALGQAF